MKFIVGQEPLAYGEPSPSTGSGTGGEPSAHRENTLLSFLQLKFNISSVTKIKNWIKYGGVKINRKVVKNPEHPLEAGQVVEFEKPTFKKEANRQPFKVHYQDGELLVVEKPSGLLSVGHEREKVKTFLNMVNGYLQMTSKRGKRAFIVHRLDRDVSGLMVFAKSPHIQEILQENWEKTVKKYLALVENTPPHPEGIIDSKLKENRAHKVYTDNDSPYSKRAITHYKVTQSFASHSLLEVDIKTGRKNQIRAHLSELGCPIVGDKKYGTGDRLLRRLGLHAFYLKFPHPRTGEDIEIKSPIPKVFARVNTLKKRSPMS